MNALQGKKTYIVAIAAAIYQALYAMGKIPVDPSTHDMILGLFVAAGAVTVRQAISKAETKPEETKSDGADDPAKPK